MMLDTVTVDEMRTAQLITGATMAICIGVGVVPPLRKYAGAVRRAAIALYLVSCVGFIVYLLIWRR